MQQYLLNFSSPLKKFLNKSLCYTQDTLQYNTTDTAIVQQRRDSGGKQAKKKPLDEAEMCANHRNEEDENELFQQ